MFQDLGGITPTIICNLISFAIIYILVRKHQLDIKSNFAIINMLVNIPAAIVILLFGFGIAYPTTKLVEVSDYVYYSIRLLSLAINFAAYFYTLSFVYDNKCDALCCSSYHTSQSQSNGHGQLARWALGTLVSRLKVWTHYAAQL